MKHHGSVVFLFLLLSIGACKKKDISQKDDFDFDKSFSINSEFSEDNSELLVTIHLANSLHAYAQGERIGKPIKIEITPKNGWKADGPAAIPAGTKKNLGALGDSVVLEGDVIIRQRLKKGLGPGEAHLYLQVCTEKVCDRPRIHHILLEANQVKK